MIYEDYVRYTKQYRGEYGDKTLVLIEVGSFWEMYNCNENGGANMNEIGDLLNIQVSRKNKNNVEVSTTNPQMAGFPTPALSKFLPILLDNGYTVVLVSQVTPPPNPQREVTHIYSQGTQIENAKSITQNVMCIYVESLPNCSSKFKTNGKVVGVAVMDVTTGTCAVAENYSKTTDVQYPLDEVYKMITHYCPCEVLFIGKTDDEGINSKHLVQYLGLTDVKTFDMFDIYDREVHDVKFQNYLLSLAYPKKENMLSFIEYVGLEKNPFALVSFVHLLRYVYRHNNILVKHLQFPKVINSCKFMNLSYNCAQQLELDGLCKQLNRCITTQGKRYFRKRLYNPYVDPDVMESHYRMITTLVDNPDVLNRIRATLKNVYDLDRLYRKMSLGTLHPCEIINVTQSLNAACNITSELKQVFSIIDDSMNSKIKECLDECMSCLNVDECLKYNLDDIRSNIFKNGYSAEVEQLYLSIEKVDKDIFILVQQLNNAFGSQHFKVDNNDRDGVFLSITTKRFHEVMKTPKSRDSFGGFVLANAKASSMQTNYTKITDCYLKKLSEDKLHFMNLFQRLIKEKFVEFVEAFAEKYENVFKICSKQISKADFYTTNAVNANQFKYVCPTISKGSKKSFVTAKAIRHPIIERLLNDIAYVPNDVDLGNEKDGMLLYGLNAAGKSSLMKATALSLVMAQCGMFVPADTLVFSPYHSLFTRIDKNDNLYTGQSTFMVEMSELRNILKRADEYSIVVGDELCSGTESASALAIVSAGIIELSKRRTTFIFATHLHDLTSIENISKLQNVTVKHLHVQYDAATCSLVYDRTLRDGQGLTTYGIEVCKALDLGDDFINMASEIRNKHLKLSSTMDTTKRSKYNAKHIVDKCQICSKPAVEVHHIRQQKDADSEGYIGVIHKNHNSNLVSVCESCHNKVHHGALTVDGYKQTNKGRKLIVKQNKDNDDENLIKLVNTMRFDYKMPISSISKQLEISHYKVKKLISIGK